MRILDIEPGAERQDLVRVLVSAHELSVIKAGFGFGLGFRDRLGLDILRGVEAEALRGLADVLRAASDAARAGRSVESSCRPSPELELKATSTGEGPVSLEMSHRVASAIENALTCVRGWTSASEASSVFCSDLDELFSLIVGMRNAKAAFVKFRRAQARQADGG